MFITLKRIPETLSHFMIQWQPFYSIWLVFQVLSCHPQQYSFWCISVIYRAHIFYQLFFFVRTQWRVWLSRLRGAESPSLHVSCTLPSPVDTGAPCSWGAHGIPRARPVRGPTGPLCISSGPGGWSDPHSLPSSVHWSLAARRCAGGGG